MTAGSPSFNRSAEQDSERTLEPWLFEAFAQLVVERTGLNILSADRATVCEKVWERTQATQQAFPSRYYQLLADASTEHLAIAEAEWPHFIALLTNSESYFFRDRGQISVLRHHILPELIMRKFADKKITLCSAGCSRGEEPYSLAILLCELIPHIEEWDVTVLGVDINAASIAHAQAGRYRQWSLRSLNAEQRERYFHTQKQHYCIDAKFQKMVAFHPLNLVSDSFPDEMQGLDLIICRNVFIYFDEASIATVIRKFYQALQPQGYLLTGHAELYGQDMKPFQIQSFPGSLVFQRAESEALKTHEHSAETAISETAIPETAISKETSVRATNLAQSESAIAENALRQAYLSFHNQAFNQAVQQIEAALAAQSHHAEAYCLMAKVYLASGQFSQAVEACNHALTSLKKSNDGNLEPHYILAKIAAEQGDLTGAKRILRKIIYLEANAVTAYLELSQLYQQEGNLKKSDRLRQLAFEIFRQQRSPAP
ncbi:MAG: CheR family methyltransferase [Phormidesmis sp.]